VVFEGDDGFLRVETIDKYRDVVLKMRKVLTIKNLQLFPDVKEKLYFTGHVSLATFAAQ